MPTGYDWENGQLTCWISCWVASRSHRLNAMAASSWRAIPVRLRSIVSRRLTYFGSKAGSRMLPGSLGRNTLSIEGLLGELVNRRAAGKQRYAARLQMAGRLGCSATAAIGIAGMTVPQTRAQPRQRVTSCPDINSMPLQAEHYYCSVVIVAQFCLRLTYFGSDNTTTELVRTDWEVNLIGLQADRR